MADSRLTYLGPLTKPRERGANGRLGSKFRLNKEWIAFGLIVVLPTLLTAIYFLLIASPRYVSEARFLVRSTSQEQPSGLGVALQGVGITSQATDSFAVHEYIRSRDAVGDLSPRLDVGAIVARPDTDFLSRYPRLGASPSDEGLFKAMQNLITVGYDTSTGISTLRVEGYTPRDARAVNQALLEGGERLVNRLNERSTNQAVTEGEQAVLEAEERLRGVQARLNSFRNREGIVDPTSATAENSGVTSQLSTTIATLRAERSQIAVQAPQSPQLPLIDARIAAFERQLEIERGRVAGNADSLATKVGGYEALEAERMMADRALAAASAALDGARNDSRRQQIYLERVVNPSLPDVPTQPRRWVAILIVFITSMLIFGIGWLVWAGLREHRQG